MNFTNITNTSNQVKLNTISCLASDKFTNHIPNDLQFSLATFTKRREQDERDQWKDFKKQYHGSSC
jgi:hypothetical protein